MKKTTLIHYDQMDVQKIVRDELEKAKPDWVEEIVDRVSKIVTEKFDKVMTTLDKFVGGIQSYQQEQTLTSDRLSKHSDQLEKIENILNKLGHSVA